MLIWIKKNDTWLQIKCANTVFLGQLFYQWSWLEGWQMTRVQPQVPLYLYRNDRAQGGGGGQNEMGLMRPADFLFIYIIAVKKNFQGKAAKTLVSH